MEEYSLAKCFTECKKRYQVQDFKDTRCRTNFITLNVFCCSEIRSRYSFESDPPITENGKSLARDMANTVVDILRKETNVQIKLFSSKLIRCIQVRVIYTCILNLLMIYMMEKNRTTA